MQSADDALDGQPDNFIVDPHFHTVEHNFLLFKTATTEVVGRKAKNDNYRQVKRFNTDGTKPCVWMMLLRKLLFVETEPRGIHETHHSENQGMRL